MLEVVFSDSVAGAMRIAFAHKNSVGSAAAASFINIINLPLALSVGTINEAGIGPEREKAISLLMGTFPSMAFQAVNGILNTAHKSYDMLVYRLSANQSSTGPGS